MTDIKELMTSLPLVSAKSIQDQSWIACPNCKERHGLFYRRHSATSRTLHYFCDKVVRHNVENKVGDSDHVRLRTVMGSVEFVDGLPISEEWTPKYKDTFQKEHHGDLLKPA